MVARRHHYVPQCYLKGFAVTRKRARQVQVFDRTSRRTFPASIADVAVEKDFNTVDLEGHAPDVFEQGLSAFETELSERIIATESLDNEEDRINLLNLIAAVAIRHPAKREIYRDFQERLARGLMSTMTSSREIWDSHIRKATAAGYISPDADTSYERMRDFVRDGNYRIDVPNEMYMKIEMTGLDAILPYLVARGWILVRASPDSGGFVTSDQPVCLIWSDPNRGPIGYGLKDTEVIFPLTNRLAVMGAFDIENEATTAPDNYVAEINGLIIAYSRRQVYARDMNFSYTSRQGEPPRKASRLMTDRNFLRS